MCNEVNSLSTKSLGKWIFLSICICITYTFHLFSLFKIRALQTGNEKFFLEWKLTGILSQEIITSFYNLVLLESRLIIRKNSFYSFFSPTFLGYTFIREKITGLSFIILKNILPTFSVSNF